MEKLVEIEDCKRCLWKGEGFRCVEIVRPWMEVQILEKGEPVICQKRIIGQCVQTQEMLDEVAKKWADLVESEK